MKILLIDDSKMVLRHIQQMLSGLGHVVREAETLAAGLRAFETDKPQAVLVDYILGDGQTGLHAIELLKTVAKEKGIAPQAWAIITHAALEEKDARRARELGVPVISKPKHGKEDDFLDSVRSLLVKP